MNNQQTGQWRESKKQGLSHRKVTQSNNTAVQYPSSKTEFIQKGWQQTSTARQFLKSKQRTNTGHNDNQFEVLENAGLDSERCNTHNNQALTLPKNWSDSDKAWHHCENIKDGSLPQRQQPKRQHLTLVKQKYWLLAWSPSEAKCLTLHNTLLLSLWL